MSVFVARLPTCKPRAAIIAHARNVISSPEPRKTMPQAPHGRFAPTPSGRMHLGNVWCALIAWLAVRTEGGTLTLRIEDLDPRKTPAVANECGR